MGGGERSPTFHKVERPERSWWKKGGAKKSRDQTGVRARVVLKLAGGTCKGRKPPLDTN